MKSAVETLEPTKVKLTVEVTYDELKPSIDHAYKHIAEQVTIPGFRKGKVPPAIIDRRVGREAVIEHAVNDGLGDFYTAAVRENELRPLGQPSVEITQLPDLSADDGELHFTAEVEVRPEVTLPDLSTLGVTVDDAAVSDEDVEARLDALRARFGTLIGVDRPAQAGDFVVIDMTATVDGEQVDSISGQSYEIGSETMLDGLDEALIGLSAGESTTFEAPLAGGDQAGAQATIAVTVTSVKTRELPEVDDDFAQLASEFDTLEELRDDLRTQVAKTKVANQAVQARDKLLTLLLEQTEIPVPSGVLDAEVSQHLSSEGREGDDEHRVEVTEEATRSLRTQILMDELVETLQVRLAQEELVEYLVSTSRQYGMDPNAFIEAVDSAGQIQQIVGEATRAKSVSVALRQVTVTDSSGAVIDLAEFIGTDADEQPAADDAAPDDTDAEAAQTPQPTA